MKGRMENASAIKGLPPPSFSLLSPFLPFFPFFRSLFPPSFLCFALQAPSLSLSPLLTARIPSLTSISLSHVQSSPFSIMSCGNGCGCCPKCGCRATCTCNRNTWFSETMSGDFSYTVAGETGKCGDCKCPAGTCAKEGSSDTSFSVAGENGGKCGNCDCPAGTCAKEGGNNGKCGANCSCPAGTCAKE